MGGHLFFLKNSIRSIIGFFIISVLGRISAISIGFIMLFKKEIDQKTILKKKNMIIQPG